MPNIRHKRPKLLVNPYQLARMLGVPEVKVRRALATGLISAHYSTGTGSLFDPDRIGGLKQALISTQSQGLDAVDKIIRECQAVAKE